MNISQMTVSQTEHDRGDPVGHDLGGTFSSLATEGAETQIPELAGLAGSGERISNSL